MSTHLNENEIPDRIISWKGKTFNQITSSIQKNTPVLNASPVLNLFFANPLKIYRREIANASLPKYGSRHSISIDELNRPNGSINNSVATNINGLVNTLDFNLVNSKYETAACLSSNSTCFSQANNAKRRVRSAGMVKRQFDNSKNNDQYCTSRNQYLVSRNKTFQQNQYNYIRQGDVSKKPGTNDTQQNVYSANGINHCKKYFIGSNASFQYQWIDGSFNTINVPTGNYVVDDLNTLLKTTMDNNYHYFINKFSNTKVFLLNITFNLTNNKVELQTFKCDTTIFNTVTYSIPYDIIIGPSAPYFVCPTSTVVTGFNILDNDLNQALGFNSGHYPAIYIGSGTQIIANQSFYSSVKPGIQPLYIPIYYKPNNPQYAQQGGVSAGSRISRLKYDAITKNSAIFRNGLGIAVANAMAYGVPENGYTIKDKIGYPNKSTPVFSKYSDTFKRC